MTVCYAIASGEYSDYRVHAIFTTKEKAEAALPLYGRNAEIEDFPLDPAVPEWAPGRHLYRCYKHLSSGVTAYPSDLSELDSWKTSMLDHFEPQAYAPNCSRVVVYAKDKEHAVKIAAEKFSKADAIQAGIAL